MKAILKNCFATLRRHLPVTLLTLAGLVAAFVAFMLILMQVSFEFGYDRFRPAADRIYRVETTLPWGTDPDAFQPSISRFDGENFMQLSPLVESAGLLFHSVQEKVKLSSGDRDGGQPLFENLLFYCSAGFPEALQFEVVEGSPALDAPDRMLIPQSLARTMFGQESPVGKPIVVVGDFANMTNRRNFTIGGVYKDIPNNSMVKNGVYVNEGDIEYAPHQKGWINHSVFFRLRSAQQKAEVENLLNTTDLVRTSSSTQKRPEIRLHLLSDIYFNTQVDWDIHGNRRMTMIFVGIAILILCIALINYFNFTVALSPFRIQSINMQKILGGRLRTLRAGLIGEAVLFCLVAYLLALVGLYGVERSSLMSYLQADMTLGDNPALLVWGALIAMGVGAIAGAYPAFYTTSIPVAITLKGSFGLSLKGRRFRTVLIGFQYVISIGLIISALFMNLQYRMIRNQDLGFNRDQVLVMPLTHSLHLQRNVLVSSFRQNPAVQEVGFSSHDIIAVGESWMGQKLPDGNRANINSRWVTPEILSLLELKIYEGRGLLPEDTLKRSVARPIVMNRTAQQAYNLKVGDRLDDGKSEIVGFVEDFNFEPLYAAVEPFMFVPTSSGRFAYVKVNTDDYRSLIASLKQTVRTLDPDFDNEPYFLDSHIEELYRADSQKITLVTFFSLLAIVISLSGVLALVSFETRHKRKEIGLRRVFGASVGQVLALFNRIYIRVVAVCFVVAAPLAWYGVQQWLQQFTVRVPMHWWVFAAVLLTVGGLTALTVTWLSYRVATDNPVKALKTE